jgi:hypothetical protein
MFSLGHGKVSKLLVTSCLLFYVIMWIIMPNCKSKFLCTNNYLINASFVSKSVLLSIWKTGQWNGEPVVQPVKTWTDDLTGSITGPVFKTMPWGSPGRSLERTYSKSHIVPLVQVCASASFCRLDRFYPSCGVESTQRSYAWQSSAIYWGIKMFSGRLSTPSPGGTTSYGGRSSQRETTNDRQQMCSSTTGVGELPR